MKTALALLLVSSVAAAQVPSMELATPAPVEAARAYRLPKWVPLATTGVTLAAAGLAVGFALDGEAARRSLREGLSTATRPDALPISQVEAIALQRRGETGAVISTAGFFATVLSLVATAVLAGFTRWVD